MLNAMNTNGCYGSFILCQGYSPKVGFVMATVL